MILQELKERFDKIFASEKYTNVLDNLNDRKKELNAKWKEYTKELHALKVSPKVTFEDLSQSLTCLLG